MSRENEAEPRSLRQRLGRFLKWAFIFVILALGVFLWARSCLNTKTTVTVEDGNQATPWPTLALPTVQAPSEGQPPPTSPSAQTTGVCPDSRRQIPAERIADPAAPSYLRDWASSTGCYPLDIQGTAALLPENLYGGSWVKGDLEFGTPFDQQLGTWNAHPGTLVMVESLTTGERCYAYVVDKGPAVGSSHAPYHYFMNEALGRCLIQSNNLPPDFQVEVLVRLINITPDP